MNIHLSSCGWRNSDSGIKNAQLIQKFCSCLLGISAGIPFCHLLFPKGKTKLRRITFRGEQKQMERFQKHQHINCFVCVLYRKWSGWLGHSNSPYSQMQYVDGEECWQGPKRSTLVSIPPHPIINKVFTLDR